MLAQVQTIGRLSAGVADFAGHSAVQLAVLLASLTWLFLGWSESALASTMTIGGFILTQMVLNQQRRRENALHLKIDELLHAMEGARSELAGVEQETDKRIEELREGQPE
jgi:low affinity Fe/Cu permease